MTPALWGAICALSLGGADFLARFTSRGLGAANALLGMLLVGAALLTLYMAVAGPPLAWSAGAAWSLVANGVATTAMTLLLYMGLARGPVSVVMPIVAAHPALVVAFAVVAQGARPGAFGWAAMAGTILGAVLVAASAEHGGGRGEDEPAFDPRRLRGTIVIAVLASLCYALLLIAGQAAIPAYGELHTLWLGRLVSIATLLLLFAARREAPRLPVRWWPLVTVQGLLDAGGWLALFAGSGGPGSEVAAVAGSGFGAVTVLLAWLVLRERIGPVQWLGIILIFGGITVLSAH